MLTSDAQSAASAGHRGPLRSAHAGELRDQLERVERARMQALTDGDRRRAIELGVRRARVQSEIEVHSWASLREAGAVERGRSAGMPGSASPSRAALDERDRFLDFQAALPDARQRPGSEFERDYAALAPLAGYSAGDYERLDPGASRRARLEVDRRLRGRRARVIDEWAREDSRPAPARRRPARPASSRHGRLAPGEVAPLDERASRDPVMRDLWAVAAGRKRELGIGRD